MSFHSVIANAMTMLAAPCGVLQMSLVTTNLMVSDEVFLHET